VKKENFQKENGKRGGKGKRKRGGRNFRINKEPL
jgi:hypothetical protein